MRYSIAFVCGLGNVVMSLVGFYHILKEAGIDPWKQVEIFDWIDKTHEDGYILGGHPRRTPIDISGIFPRIGFTNTKKSLKDKEVNFTTFFCNDYYYGDKFRKLLDHTADRLTEWNVVMGWFFHPAYRSTYRDEIIRWLEIGEVVKDDVREFFVQNDINPANTVSFHCRLGSPGDNTSVVKIDWNANIKGLVHLRRIYPKLDTVLVCSDSREKFEKHYSSTYLNNLGYRYIFYDRDIEKCMYAMKECAHHILSNSTLSYNVVYLDEKFPERSLAIGSHFEYIRPDFVDKTMISKDGRTGLLHFRDVKMKYSMIPVCGMGNVIISLAGFYHTLKEAGLDPNEDTVFFDWTDRPFEEGVVFGGHARHKTRSLGDVFSKIGYMPVQKSLKDSDTVLMSQFCNDIYMGDQLEAVTNLTKSPETSYSVIWSWFSHLLYREKYREEIMKWLEFGEEIQREVRNFFIENSINPDTTISLHCRLGSSVDFIPIEKVKPDDYIKGLVYLKNIYPQLTTVLVCSESRVKFENYLSPEIIESLGLRYIFYNADPENCIQAMKECAHHVVSNSTLSYVVMYLDPKFPHHTLAIGTHMEYMNVQMVTPDITSVDGYTGLLHFKDLS